MVDRFSDINYDRLIVPLAVDAELRFGFLQGNKSRRSLTVYELFVQKLSVSIVPPDQATAIIYAELAGWARQHGVSLSNNDLWIAATVVQHDASLFTSDQDFARLPQVRLAA